MKKLLCIALFSPMLLFNCTKRDLLQEQRDLSLSTGIIVDTTMFDVCFNDSPEEINTKFKRNKLLGRYSDEFEYYFPDERLKYDKWEWRSICWSFHNDSLIRFSIYTHTVSRQPNIIKALENIYTNKYDAPLKIDGHLYWFKGNLEIELYASDWGVYINYTNLLYKPNYNDQVTDENYNTYSNEYWEKYKAPIVKEKLDQSGKDI